MGQLLDHWRRFGGHFYQRYKRGVHKFFNVSEIGHSDLFHSAPSPYPRYRGCLVRWPGDSKVMVMAGAIVIEVGKCLI